jgi:hypothetical protein
MTAAPTVLPLRRRDMLLADHILRTYAVLSNSLLSRIRATLCGAYFTRAWGCPFYWSSWL